GGRRGVPVEPAPRRQRGGGEADGRVPADGPGGGPGGRPAGGRGGPNRVGRGPDGDGGELVAGARRDLEGHGGGRGRRGCTGSAPAGTHRRPTSPARS